VIISANIAGLNDDNNTVTLKWYKDLSGQISGVYLDSGGANLANYITFSAVKGIKGAKIALGGLQADGFYIKRDSSGDYKIGGKIYLVNSLTFSILKNGGWKNLDISWNLDLDGIGYIELNADPQFALEENDFKISAKIKGVDVTLYFFDITNHCRLGWDVNFDLQGYIQFDTNGEPLFAIGFALEKNSSGYYPKWGISIHGNSFAAENYQILWDFSNPPGQWILQQTGTVTGGEIDQMSIAWNNNWYNVLQNGQPEGG
jgi:hypothetical protein